MDVFRVSLRAAIRGAAGRPGFAAGIMAILALGLGANAITFGLVDRLILSGPSGVYSPDEVRRVVLHHERRGSSSVDTGYSYVDYRDLQNVEGLTGAAGEAAAPQLLGAGDTAERIRAKLVTANYFSLLGVRPALGRFFTADESEREGARLVVLGHALWQRRYAGDPAILGRVLEIGANHYTVVGVAPRNFTGSAVTRADLFLPLEAAADEIVSGPWRTSRIGWMNAIVRLAPGASAERAEAMAAATHRGAHDEDAAEPGSARYEFVPLTAVRSALTPGEVTVAGLAAAVALLVFVIAIANVANLFLARSLRRSGEMAVKMALGSSRSRLIAEQAVEGALLATAGAGIAAIIAIQGTRIVQRLLLPDVDWLDATMDLRGSVFIIACAIVGGALASGIPVWITGKADVVQWLKSASTRTGTRRSRMQGVMLALQGTLTVLLLVGAGLFVRSLAQVRGIDPGVDAGRLVTVGLAPGTTPMRPELYDTLRERLQRLPGIERTSIVVGTIPFVSSWATTLVVPSLPERPRVRSGGPYVLAATPDYFETSGTRVTGGRRFTDADRAGAELVAIVNQRMAKLYWPAESPIGQCLRIGPDAGCSTIVGVAEDTRRSDLIGDDSLLYYIPLAQAPPAVLRAARRIVVRTTDDSRATVGRVVESIRREALAIEPSLRYVGASPLADAIEPQMRAWQLGATLFSAFGILALVVAAVGLYSVVAFDVEGRRRELGLRAALGARAVTLRRFMMLRTARSVGVGIALGLATAWLAAPSIGGMLYEVSPHDPLVFAAVASALVLTSLLASAVPAQRAARIDPGEALRDE